MLCVVGPLPQLLWGYTERMQDNCPDCPESVLLVERNDALRDVFDAPHVGGRRVIVATVLVVLIRQWRSATAPQRRAMAPVLWSGGRCWCCWRPRSGATPPAARGAPTCSAGPG